jgi:hypothetical protein
MRPFALLRCIARAALRHAGNLVGFCLGDVVEEIWNNWHNEKDEAARRAELQELVQMAAAEFRQQVEAVVRAVAGGQPAEVQQRMSSFLQQVPEMLRLSLRRPEDDQGRSVPPGFRLQQASDLAVLLSAQPRVTIQLTAGHGAGEAIDCSEPTVLLLGRAKDCRPRYPREQHESVSRHHCLVEINPPDVRIRDLGSLRGTFIDGRIRDLDSRDFTPVQARKLGGRPKGSKPDVKYSSSDVELADGAEVRLTKQGQAAFRVLIHLPAQLPVVQSCAWCHREVTAERGANRPGLFVCGACRENLKAIMHDLAGHAHAGDPNLRALRSYTLGDELGHGGMGAVYLARHARTGQHAAIKLMLPNVAADDRAVAMFQREIRNTMALQHRHVVRLLDHGYARGAFFMVLEYCDGGSADKLLAQRGGVLPVDEAVEIVLQALDGLAYAHRAPIPFVRQKGGGFAPGTGLVHRDLKPANLFLSGWGSSRVVKIGDYGLAKAFDETGLSGGTRTGETAGTWKFMCRQQVVDYQHAPPAVDVWAMAASLYNLLTGQVPRAFPTGRDPWLVVLEDAPVPILKRNPRLPPRLAEVVDRALLEEPCSTFQSAAEFKEALEEAL